MWDEQRKNVCVKDLEASWKIPKQVQKVPQPFSSHYIYECEEVSSTLDKLCHQVESTRDNYMLCWAPSPVFIVVHLTTPKSRVIPADLPNYTQDASFFCSMFLFFKGLFFFLRFIYLFLAKLSFCCCLQAFSRCGKQGLLCCSAWASHGGGFSCCRAQALSIFAQQLWHTGLVALWHGGSSQTRDRIHVLCISRWIFIQRSNDKMCIKLF